MDGVHIDDGGYDPIPFQNLFTRNTEERKVFEDRLRKKDVRSVTLIKPDIVLYTLNKDEGRTVYCLEAGDWQRSPNRHRFPVSSVKPSHIYRNSVVKILNLSHEHRVRIGLLLEDRSILVSLLDQKTFGWSPKGQICADFDLEYADRIVYSRTADSLFWPVRNSEGTWDVMMCSVDSRQQRVFVHGLPELHLQTLRDELVLLFVCHGVLFLEYRQMRDSRDNRFRRLQQNNSFRSTESLLSTQSTVSSNEETTLKGYYWNPENLEMLVVSMDNFEPKQTSTSLQGFCHCKETKPIAMRKIFPRVPPKEAPLRTVVLYGDTVFKLTAQLCTPLLRINVPSHFTNFKFMYLGRIVVLQNDDCIAGYFNSKNPTKFRDGPFLSAGYGIVCKSDGLFRIKMSEPRVDALYRGL